MTDVYLYQTIHLLDGFCRNLAEHLALLDGWARSLFGFSVPLDEEQARRMLREEARRNAPVGCDRSLFVRLAVDDSGEVDCSFHGISLYRGYAHRSITPDAVTLRYALPFGEGPTSASDLVKPGTVALVESESRRSIPCLAKRLMAAQSLR